MIDDTLVPRLRPLDIRRVAHDGAEYFYLRDALGLTEQQLLVPVALGPLLALLDGTRTLRRLRMDVLLRCGLPLADEHLAGLVDALSAACLLHDDVYAAALRRAVQEYRAAPSRRPAHCPGVYPGDARELAARLWGYEGQVEVAEAAGDDVLGIISPHIDYRRGGPVYASLFRRAAPALRAAEVAVIFGTDHGGAPGTLTLTRQAYATPYGVLPTAVEAVDALVDVLGEDAAFAEEIHHRGEHSVELAAVWLHHVRAGASLPIVPVLCGHPRPYLEGGGGGGSGSRLPRRAMEALRRATAGRRVITIAAADLAHVGPAFGDPEPFSAVAKRQVRLADEELLSALDHGPEAVLRAVGRIGDRHRICGLSPMALALAFTGPVRAEVTDYDQCPADHDGGAGSIVSIAGVILRRP